MKLRSMIAACVVCAVAASSLLAAPQTAPAGKRPDGKRPAGMRMMHGQYGFPQACEKDMNLTAAQKTKLKALTDKYRAEVKKLMAPGVKPDVRKAKMTALRQKHQNEVKAVLTDAQEKKLADCMAKQRKMHPRPDRDKAKAKPAK